MKVGDVFDFGCEIGELKITHVAHSHLESYGYIYLKAGIFSWRLPIRMTPYTPYELLPYDIYESIKHMKDWSPLWC